MGHKKNERRAIKKAIKSDQIEYKVNGNMPLYTEHGEKILANVIDVKVSQDVNWFKVYMANLAGILDVVGNQKMTVFAHIIENVRRSDNLFMGTIRETVEKTGCSLQTVANTFKLLQRTGFWVKVRNGTYAVNPDIAMYGDTMKRGFLMMQFKEKEDSQLDIFERERKAS